MAFAQGRASSYESNDIGATSPGLWHVAHFSNRMGAISFAKVGAVAAGALCTDVIVAAATARVPARTESTRFMDASLQPEILPLLGRSRGAVWHHVGHRRDIQPADRVLYVQGLYEDRVVLVARQVEF